MSIDNMMVECEPWNTWDTNPPPVCRVKTLLRHAEIENMKYVLDQALATLRLLKVFYSEAVVLSRYLYRFKRIFRHDKGAQNLVKMNQALHRYLKINIEETLSTFRACLPAKVTPRMTHSYLPTRQMLKWVLLRILSLTKVLGRIIAVSKEAGMFINGRLRLGWSGCYMVVALGIIGRILACSKFLLLSATDWYHKLRIDAKVLTETVEYLPDFKFPKNIDEFAEGLNPPAKKADMDKIFELIDLTTMNENEEDDDIIVLNQPEQKEEQKKRVKRVTFSEIVKTDQDEDMAIVFEKTETLDARLATSGPLCRSRRLMRRRRRILQRLRGGIQQF